MQQCIAYIQARLSRKVEMCVCLCSYKHILCIFACTPHICVESVSWYVYRLTFLMVSKDLEYAWMITQKRKSLRSQKILKFPRYFVWEISKRRQEKTFCQILPFVNLSLTLFPFTKNILSSNKTCRGENEMSSLVVYFPIVLRFFLCFVWTVLSSKLTLIRGYKKNWLKKIS